MLPPWPWPHRKPTSSPSGNSFSRIEESSASWSPAGQVGAANGAAEKDVADNGEAGLLVEEDHRAGAVAGAEEDLEFVPGDRDRIAFLEPPVGGAAAGALEAERLRLLVEPLQHLLVGLVRTDDVDAEMLFQFLRAGGMVDMAVGQQNLFNRHADLFDGIADAVDLSARIDDDAALGIIVPQKRAVLLELGDDDDSGAQSGHDGAPLGLIERAD